MLKPNNQDRHWTILESEYLIRRPWLTARKDRVRLPNGAENEEYYVLEYPDWVNVIALTRDGAQRRGERRVLCIGISRLGECHRPDPRRTFPDGAAIPPRSPTDLL